MGKRRGELGPRHDERVQELLELLVAYLRNADGTRDRNLAELLADELGLSIDYDRVGLMRTGKYVTKHDYREELK